MKLINETFEKEDPESDDAWMRKIKTANITYFIKKGGSHLHKTQPFIRFKYTYPKAFKVEKLIKVVSAPLSKEWDKNVREQEIIPSKCGS